MNFFFKNRFTFIGFLLGAIGGYAYYHFVGCTSGTCAITSNPLFTVLYGALLVGMFTNIFQDLQTKKIQSKK